MNIKLSPKEISIIIEAINKMDYADSEFAEEEADALWSKLQIARSADKTYIEKGIGESLNEEVQILDKVRYNKDRGYVIGEIEGKLLVQIQGNTFLVNPNEVKEWNKKPDLTTVPHMKFDEETQKLLFEQFVRCAVYHGNVPIKMNDCYVKYSHWEKANSDQQIKVLVEGNTTFMPKSQIRILEDLNDFANEDNYVPGVLIDESSEEVIENVLVHAIDYTSAIGDADSVRVIKKNLAGEQEIQTVPKAMVRTLAV
jgi:hypothetical protein